MPKKKKKSKLKEFKRKNKPKAKRFMNILVGLTFFVILVGSAFAVSPIFGVAFVVAFALAIYTGELKDKPWKPIAVFVGAVIVRLAIQQYFNPIFAAKTLIDLIIAALIFTAILIFGWKIKKS